MLTLLLVAAFPLALLVLMLLMERVERPLRPTDRGSGEDLEEFLASARSDEVDTFVSEGFTPALERYWRRRRLARILPGRVGRRATRAASGGAAR